MGSLEMDNTVISSPIIANSEMSSIECHVPRLSSDHWEWREYNLNVKCELVFNCFIQSRVFIMSIANI